MNIKLNVLKVIQKIDNKYFFNKTNNNEFHMTGTKKEILKYLGSEKAKNIQNLHTKLKNPLSKNGFADFKNLEEFKKAIQ